MSFISSSKLDFVSASSNYYFSFNFSFWFSLQPSGGSGMYIWSSCNTSVATVSTKGVVITTNAVGHTQARAADMKNLAIFGTAEVGS